MEATDICIDPMLFYWTPIQNYFSSGELMIQTPFLRVPLSAAKGISKVKHYQIYVQECVNYFFSDRFTGLFLSWHNQAQHCCHRPEGKESAKI